MSTEERRQFLINYAIDKIIAYLIEERGISLEEALDVVYSSEAIEILQDETIALTSYSPSYIYELFTRSLAIF
ncbi:MAG: hypothetical protein IKI67_04640 [Bacteroidales bacterium]|nr:hypothetical protein [Bacteroidales bacterium]